MLYKPVWAFIPMSRYHRPGFPARAAVRKELSSFWYRIHPVMHWQQRQRKELRTIPPYLLDRAAPMPDSVQCIHALQFALQGWRQNRAHGETVQVVVGAPGSGVERAVMELGKKRGWQMIGPPSPEQILCGGEAWLEQVQAERLAPLVLPYLGKCYLRHQEGLYLISRLLDWLQTTERRCLIACDSWAWAYLVHALQINVMLPEPMVLAPFDGPRLQFWLPSLSRRIHQNRFVFRTVGDGHPLFPMADRYAQDMSHLPEQEALYGEWVGVSYFIRQLAAYCHGLPEVVWTIWRQSLQVRHDVQLQQTAVRADAADERFTLWVPPWPHIKLPVVPAPIGTNECLVLHTLLLHGGMTAGLLAGLLPLSYSQVRRILHFFWEAGLLAYQAQSWQVSLLGYPAVRQFLAQEGYLVDDF